MKSFYSIVKLSPNIATEDSVALGVLFFDGEKFQYFFSDKKKRLAKSSLSQKDVDLNFIIRQIKEKCEVINSDEQKIKMFYDFQNFSDASYFQYLSSYSNGLLQFAKPKALFNKNVEFSFEKLVGFLFDEPLHKAKEIEYGKDQVTQHLIQEKLINRVNEQVHTRYKFNSETFPSIYFSYEMDCIGLNGSLIGAKSLSFDKSPQTIDHTISHYFTLISSLASKYNKSLSDNNFYLISEEPETIGGKEHKLWESVKYNEIIDVVNPEESNKVADMIEEKKASKFLEETQ